MSSHPGGPEREQWERLGEVLGGMVRGEVEVARAGRDVRELAEGLGSPAVLRELLRWLVLLDTWIPTDVTPVSFPEDQIRQQARELLAGPWPPVTR